jgi:hypothetical protein
MFMPTKKIVSSKIKKDSLNPSEVQMKTEGIEKVAKITP